MAAEFSIVIDQPDKAFRGRLAQELTAAGLEFRQFDEVDLMESVGSGDGITGFALGFSSAFAIAGALKHLAPVLVEYIKSKQIQVKHADGSEITVSSAADLENATQALAALSESKPKRKKQ